MAKKYMSLERLTEYDELIKAKIDAGDQSVKSYVDTEVAKKANSSHTHDDRYYTETEIDTKISGVNSTISTHTGNSDIHVTTTNKSNWNSAYTHSTSAHAPSNAEKNIIVGIQKNGTDLTVNSSTRKVNITVPTTAAEIGAATSDHNHDDKYDTKGAANTALDSAKSYTDTKTNGMATTTVVDNKISAHNTSATAHGDIRDLISALTTKVNNFLDVDDTKTDQLSEILELIENNKGTLDSITSNKINVSDIVNNLTTASTTKVLSANQGVVIKGLIDALQAEVDGKADTGHGHAIADVSGLQTALDGKAASSHGTHVSFDSTNKPKMDGTAAFGTSSKVARADHVHPTDTSRASQADLDALEDVVAGKANTSHSHAISDVTNLQSSLDAKAAQTSLDSHTGNTTVHITSTERTNWNAAKTHADSTHAPSNAQANVIESIKVNGTAQTITSKAVNITVPTKASDIGAATASHTHAISEITNLQSTLTNASNAISANTGSITALTDRTKALEDIVGDGIEEITTAEIQALFA